MHQELVGGLCAVYGSLRDGLGNHGRLVGAPRQEDGVIKDQFRMVSLGGFPGLLEDGEATDIVVEVYEVESSSRAMGLDSLEGYPSFYNRRKVVLDDGRVCWVYFLEGTRYNELPKVLNGDWKDYV